MEQYKHDTQGTLISLLDLGLTTSEMKEYWYTLSQSKQPIYLKEFPTIDISQSIDASSKQDLMSFVLVLMDVLHTQQRQVIRNKQAMGIQRAREKGIQLGRRPLQIPEQFYALVETIERKEISLTAASRILKVDYKTVKKWMQSMKEEQGGS